MALALLPDPTGPGADPALVADQPPADMADGAAPGEPASLVDDIPPLSADDEPVVQPKV